ncbi:hypothetical protein [Streptomyces sp. NPDC089919]|uniref:hypothetical protein n=1 Tax=Streptomyces sp. NPDC089919 TaxID=3155188 RepID=UPI0034211E4D
MRNDARSLLHAVVPTAAVGAIAAAVSGVVAGGKGALGAVVGAVIVILFMGSGMAILQWIAKSFPQLFQMMGLALYTVQLLVLFVFVAVFKDTTLFNPRSFAITLVVTTLAWIAAQARAHMKAKILYVDPDAAAGESPKTRGPRREG